MEAVSAEKISQTFLPDYFKGLSTFGAISEETIVWLLNNGKIIQLSPGEQLYCAGAKVQEFYIIISGKLSLFRHYETNPALTRSYRAGEQVGFSGMIALHDRRNTAIADEASFVLEVSADQFFELHISAPQDFGILVLNLAREMARTIGQMGDQIELLSDQSLPTEPH